MGKAALHKLNELHPCIKMFLDNSWEVFTMDAKKDALLALRVTLWKCTEGTGERRVA